MSEPDRPFRWEDLDQRLIKPELQRLTDKMQKRAVDGKRRVVLESSRSGNAGSFFPLFFDFQEQLADEWVQELYILYRDAPNRQNRSVTPAFIREVWDRGIFPFIAARTATVLGEVSLDVARTRKQRNEVAEGGWVRRMRRFATRWRDKLEAEAVTGEYSALQEIAQRAAADTRSKQKKGRPPDKMAAARRETIRRVAARGLKGKEYCEALDRIPLGTSIRWQQNEGCPKKYLDAFNHLNLGLRKKWRDRIANEKYLATRFKPLA